MEQEKSPARPIGFATIIFINFLTLKLCSLIDWNWIWVLAPVWIPIAIKTVLWTILKGIELVELIKNNPNKNGNT